MDEFRERVERAEAELREKLKYGYAINEGQGRRHRGRGPQQGDTIVSGGRERPVF